MTRRCWVVLSAALLGACTGPEIKTKKKVADLLTASDHSAAAAAIEAKALEYGPSNYVLYHLDLGLALHYAGKLEESSRSFVAVEAKLEELYTKSVTAAAGGLLANENIKAYRGHPSDRALALLFDALNRAQQGDGEAALVSIRRMEAFLDELGRTSNGKRGYVDDGLAHYVAALLYAEEGKEDDARISHEAAARAYKRYPELYGTPVPPLPAPGIPADMGEVVFIHYNGPAPRKISVSGPPPSSAEPATERKKGAGGLLGSVKRATDASVNAAVGIAGGAAGVVTGVLLQTSHPEYRQDPFTIVGSELVSSAGSVASTQYADISAIVARDLRDDLFMLHARSSLRAALKLAQQAVTSMDASGSEFADVRSWSLLPSQIRVARLALRPGVHPLELRYKDAAGAVLSTRRLDVVTRAGRRIWVFDRTGT